MPLSREVNNWIVLCAATLVILGFGPHMLSDFAALFKNVMTQAPGVMLAPVGIGLFAQEITLEVLRIIWLPILFLVVAALIGPLGQVGILFAPESIKPSLSKISVIKGAQRLFSMRSLMEFLKGILKLSIIALVGFIILRPFYDGIDHLVGLNLLYVLDEIKYLLTKLMVGVLVVLIVVAVIDLVYQRMEHHKKMRMTREEVKDEYKQSEGDPQVKAKLRQLRTQRARQRMMQAVPESDVVITNPTHFACALKYDPDENGCTGDDGKRGG